MNVPKRPLILADPKDIHAHAFAWAASTLGVEVIWGAPAPGDRDSSGLRPFSVYVDEVSGPDALDLNRLYKVTGVLYRAPYKSRRVEKTNPDEEQFVKSEWMAFNSNIEALACSVLGALWVNRPVAAIAARNKILQLRAAKKCGLKVPPTLISYCPRDIRSFFTYHKEVIYKTFTSLYLGDAIHDHKLVTPATLLESVSEISDCTLRQTPGIYQKYIRKNYDLRVTVIGEKLFPVKIMSASNESFTDWRVITEEENCVFKPLDLDANFRGKIYAFMKNIGLVSGSLDFAVGKNGEAFFLEVNESGQFLFLERRCPNLRLLEAMTQMLVTGRIDYACRSRKRISYAKYLDSKEYFEEFRAS